MLCRWKESFLKKNHFLISLSQNESDYFVKVQKNILVKIANKLKGKMK